MRKRTIVLRLKSYSYVGLITFSKRISDGFNDDVASYPSPQPTTAAFDNSVAQMQTARNKWGTRGSVGGKPQLEALRYRRSIVWDGLRSLAGYAMVAQPDNYESWLRLGFELKREPARIGTMQSVRDLRRIIARNIAYGNIKLSWKRPLAVAPTTQITFLIFRSEDEHYRNAVHIDSVQNKCSYLDTPPKTGVVYYYWVVPVNTAGRGVISETCPAFANPI